jgi:hypothetical protein
MDASQRGRNVDTKMAAGNSSSIALVQCMICWHSICRQWMTKESLCSPRVFDGGDRVGFVVLELYAKALELHAT